MPSGTLQVYTALAENAAPLPGVTVLVLNEAGTQIARLTTNDVGSAPELVLTAPDEAYIARALPFSVCTMVVFLSPLSRKRSFRRFA